MGVHVLRKMSKIIYECILPEHNFIVDVTQVLPLYGSPSWLPIPFRSWTFTRYHKVMQHTIIMVQKKYYVLPYYNINVNQRIRERAGSLERQKKKKKWYARIHFYTIQNIPTTDSLVYICIQYNILCIIYYTNTYCSRTTTCTHLQEQ